MGRKEGSNDGKNVSLSGEDTSHGLPFDAMVRRGKKKVLNEKPASRNVRGERGRAFD